MNERVAQVGNQLKGALDKVVTAWKELEAARKRLILLVALGIVALAVGIIVVVSLVNGRYVVLYENMSRDDSVAAKAILETDGIPSRINSKGELEVPQKSTSVAMGRLAQQGIPSTSLDYNVFADASGLTTTEFEKRRAMVHQWEVRLQDVIKRMDGVVSADVTLNIDTTTERVWDPEATKNSGSVMIAMQPGYTLTQSQAYAVRYLIGSSVGVDPTEVTVMDSEGTLLAAAGQGGDIQAQNATMVLERMGIEAEVENRLKQKAATVMNMVYPDAAMWDVECYAQLDYDAMVTEIKEYMPLDGTNAGVLDEEEIDALLGTGQFAEGVVGETDNTDVPIYVDLDGDGTMDTVDFHRFRDYAVSYTLQQIEKDGPSLSRATLTVVINDTANAEKMQNLRTSISGATGLPVEDINVQSFLVTTPEPDPGPQSFWQSITQNIPPLYLYIALATIVVLVIVLVLVLILRSKAKKKRLAAELAAAEEEAAEAERIQAEIEDRKQQLKNAAMMETQEDAISVEVKDFARQNPEITATLLRNWLKED